MKGKVKMKKKLVKPLVVLLIVLQILIISSSVFAVDNANIGDSVLLYAIEKMDYIEVGYWGQDITIYQTVYKDNGIEYPAYCVDYAHKGITYDRTYNVEIKESYIDENYINTNNRLKVWKVILNGYPFKSIEGLNEHEAYAATKLAVFYVLENWEQHEDKVYYKNAEGKKVVEAMFNIVEEAKKSEAIPTSTKIDLSGTELQIDEIDNKYLSKKITLSCETPIAGFSVNLKGNVPEGTIITDLENNQLEKFKNCKEFKILLPLENLKSENEFTINVQGEVISYPMYLGVPEISGVQTYVLTKGKLKPEGADTLIQYPQNKTKLIIKKQDEKGNILPQVKFNVLDSNKEIVYENLETNEQGIIEIENIIPGQYYLQEVETIEGYEFSNELIEFNIDLDEEKEIVVENKEIPEEPEKPKEPEKLELPKLPRTGW